MPINFYHSNVEKFASKLSVLHTKLRNLTLFRILSFLLVGVFLYCFASFQLNLFAVLAIVFFVIFLFLVKRQSALSLHAAFVANLLQINKNEIAAIEGSFVNSSNGKQFQDAKHPFANDLDVFGEASIFAQISRCTNSLSEQKLADLLMNIEKNANSILQKQEAVKELSAKPEFAQKLQALGMNNANFVFNKNIFDSTSNLFRANNLAKLLVLLSVLISMVLWLSAIFGKTAFEFAIGYGIFQLFIVSIFLKKTNALHNTVGKQHENALKFAEIAKHLHETEFSAALLKNLQQKLQTQNASPSEVFSKLASILKMFDYRLNWVFIIPANGLFLYDLFCIYRYETWQAKYAVLAEKIVDVHAEFEAYCSLGNFARNNPNFVYAKISEEILPIKAQEMGHPLIPASKRVCNNFEIEKFGNTVFVTGANMAGKSTFLRTVGVSLVLAQCGVPVCAKKFEFTPCNLYTAMRTDDSLKDSESYFFAELKRLKAMVEQIRTDEPIFVITDEMLRGTNSDDKHKGTEGFIKQLLKHKVAGIIASHDVSLGRMELEFPQQITNLCFEVGHKDDELIFNYKLQKGVSKNMNAGILMRKMQILID